MTPMPPLLAEGVAFGSLNVIVMLLLEFGVSLEDVRQLRKREGGKELHLAGMVATAFNSIVLGSITYAVIIKYCCVQSPLTIIQKLRAVMVFLVIENTWYYLAHMTMHTRKFFWMHRFHHKFNVVILPSSASAVSIPEFLLAYMSPFIVGSYIGGTDKSSAIIAAMIVMAANFFIHTPALEETMSRLPWFFVTPSDHFTHHRQLTCNYGAPVFSIDRIVNVVKAFLGEDTEQGMESVPSLDGDDSDESFEDGDENSALVESKKEL
jgi:sterol desaturase/sphingolipid hydroxylase (fatty acid hydroxylase superfamily)